MSQKGTSETFAVSAEFGQEQSFALGPNSSSKRTFATPNENARIVAGVFLSAAVVAPPSLASEKARSY